MNKDKLLASLPVIFESSHGVQPLYSLLKSLAIRGKLNVDCLDNCSINELISDLKDRKNLFMSDHGLKVKHNDSANEISAFDFELPTNWGLVPLREICFAQAGFAFSASHFNSNKEGIPLIRIRDIERGFSETYYSGEYRPEFLVKKGEWLIGMDGNFNVRQWQGETALLNQRVTRLHFYDERINQLFISIALEEHLHSLMGTKSYTTVDHLSTKQIEAAPIPLPCLNEQNSVISCIIELKTDLDNLQKTQNLVRDLNSAARKSALDAVSKAQTREEFDIAWNRIQENWGVIAATPDAIESIKTLVLDLAVRGDLITVSPPSVSQDIEWTASELKLDDSKLWHLPTLRKSKKQSWNRIPLAKIGSWGSGGTPTSSRKDFYQNGTIPWAVIGDLNNDVLTSTEAKITEKALQESSSKMVPKGSILIAMYGASIGKTALTGIECCTNQAIAHCVVDTKIISKEYFFIVAKSLKRHLIQEGKGAAQPNISQSVLKHLIIDLPPLDEQLLIVDRVEELIQMCDRLNVSLSESEVLAEKFAHSVVSASA